MHKKKFKGEGFEKKIYFQDYPNIFKYLKKCFIKIVRNSLITNSNIHN